MGRGDDAVFDRPGASERDHALGIFRRQLCPAARLTGDLERDASLMAHCPRVGFDQEIEPLARGWT